MKHLLTSLLASSLLVLAACSTPNNEDEPDYPEANENYLDEVYTDTDAAFDFISGKTLLFYDPYYEETESVTYFTPDGWFYDWFTEEEELYIGRWEMRRDNYGGVELCIGYAEYDAADGSDWYCDYMDYWAEAIYERAQGDPFGLQSAKAVPWFMRYGGDYDLKTLARYVGLPPFSIQKLDTAFSVGEDYGENGGGDS